MIRSCASPHAIRSRRLSFFWHSHRESDHGLVCWEHINSHLHTDSMSSKPSGGFFVLVVRILGMDSRGAGWTP